MAAQEISSSTTGGWAKPKQKDLTGSWKGQNSQDKSTAPKMKKAASALEKTTMYSLGVKPFIRSRTKDDEETQLLALSSRIIAQQDKFESDKVTNGAVGNSDDHDALLDNLDIDWEFTSRTSPLTPVGRDSPAYTELDYSSDKSETGSVKALGDEEDKDSKADNSFFGAQDDKTTAPKR